ncbi:hypothetical protein OIU77_007845 [Salix suchowensis]|uniref:Uncharacterized protein n=1 Tax=Salix suchowensis TaxID=1278906 RepID=A0ABQ9AIX4_9ROSI|nr:hypothetical protein OIU77_007845 [Salix suchowensis]
MFILLLPFSDAAEPSLSNPQKYRPDVPGISDHRTGHLSSGVKKSELKIGESSALFTYIKSGTVKNNSQGVALIDDNTNQNLRMEEKLQVVSNWLMIPIYKKMGRHWTTTHKEMTSVAILVCLTLSLCGKILHPSYVK